MSGEHLWRVASSVGDSTLYSCSRCGDTVLVNDKAGFGELERRGGVCIGDKCNDPLPTIRVTEHGTIIAALCEQDRATLKRLEDNVKSLCHEIAGLRKHLGMIAHE